MSVSRMLLGQGPLPQQIPIHAINLLVPGGPVQQSFFPAELRHGSDVSTQKWLFPLGSSEVAPLFEEESIYLFGHNSSCATLRFISSFDTFISASQILK